MKHTLCEYATDYCVKLQDESEILVFTYTDEESFNYT
ncbi:hypothetical protein ND2E_1994 [Colwellia psychrerythraea]|uniref:Uncharacterized protein n=1 Tax=Colwellia psychrerythraea TaxID=28229 RepID=A0A099KU41_COLPS|nr:hypothetical protein ND2E_1994 [Colwellia psychrerythraea]